MRLTSSANAIAFLAAFLPPALAFSTRGFFRSRSLWTEPMDQMNVPVASESSPPPIVFPLESNLFFTHPNFSASLLEAADSNDAPMQFFDKSVFDFLTATNLSLPLGSEKFFWLNTPMKPMLEQSESTKNDVSDQVKYSKAVSLCDKTLAITEYIADGKDSGKSLVRCELYDLEKNPEKAYSEAHKTGITIQRVEFEPMRDIINNCREMAEIAPELSSPIIASEDPVPGNMTTSDSGRNSMWTFWRALLPGTKWCGLGDSAKSYYDLGKRKDVDVCCRAHDHCPIRLKALRVGYGLMNLSLYTKSHCECDEDFMRCLRQANSKMSEMLGNFYFNIMKVQCIKEEKSLVCKEFRKLPSGKDECVRYEEDKSGAKMVFTQPETTY